ncbi:uncharacterized protein LOC129745170 isoform X2 [Uranotaenia lowii]|uniref:uncharacterized protein LOC129745170 isoform X2 n=1 Tax=Uranotaenia lowii TaxID=190385 RepID=UPI002478BE9F|nr:uncharacterized protein LOC129745170 isoform X2 [Uranotaenia lowii]
MFSFFKRSKSQKSKQKQNQSQHSGGCNNDASKDAVRGACDSSNIATPSAATTLLPPQPAASSSDQDGCILAEVVKQTTERDVSECGGNDGPTAASNGNVKNNPSSPPTATSIFGGSPSDIIRANGRSFDVEDDGTGRGVIEFVDQEGAEEWCEQGNANEDESREDTCLSQQLQVREETYCPKSEKSASDNQNAIPFECAMAKGKNKRRYQQQQQQQQQSGKGNNQHQGQKPQASKGNHHLSLKPELNGKEDLEKVSGPIINSPAIAKTVKNVQPTDSKVNRNEHNNSNDVKTVGSDNENVNFIENHPWPSPMVACDVNNVSRNVEDHEVKISLVGNPPTNNKPSNDKTENECVSVANQDQTATPPAQSVTSSAPSYTQTTPNDDDTVDELLNDINGGVSVPENTVLPTAELHSSVASHEIKEDVPHDWTGSSDPVTNRDNTSIGEMGQQPSKPNINQTSSRRSVTPNRNPQTTTNQPIIVQVKQDAPRDDISDDRDIFYEATESLLSTSSSPVTSPLDGPDKAVAFEEPILHPKKEESPLKAALINPQHQSEPRTSPKKRVVFSEQLIIEGNPPQDLDLCNHLCDSGASSGLSSTSASTESLPNALILEAENYEQVVAKNNDEQMHAEFSPTKNTLDSLVNNIQNSVNVLLSVSNQDQQHAFTSDKSGVRVPSSMIITTNPSPNKLIEFQYDHSSEPSDLSDKDKPSHKLEENEKNDADPPTQPSIAIDNGDVIDHRRKDSSPLIVENSSSAKLIVEDSISLPDVVQPTPIEKSAKQPFTTVDAINSEMKELVNQETRYSVKLEDAEKRASEAQTKVYELQIRLDQVERDVSVKECNIERLKAELEAACKECEGIRNRLRSQESELTALRLKSSDREDELNLKYQNLEVEMLELNEKLKEVRELARDLNAQLSEAKRGAEKLQQERDSLLDQRAESEKLFKEALELALAERAQMEAKWKNEFEQLRTVNSDRQEQFMEDCEWKIRTMQKSCKEKIEAAERERKVAMDKMARLEQDSRKQAEEVKHLRSYEAEVSQLRGLTYDQKEALTSMTRQVDQLRAELETANNKLEAEIVKVQQIKNRCEYQLCEKEREALSRIEIARGEIAMQWEDRLLHEMNRLKMELEQMYLEERITAIDKIKKEALQETEALMHKFNMRERQLKEEIESLKGVVEKQRKLMAETQSEADVKVLQWKMYADKADRDHEMILARETNRREELVESLKDQHEKEKTDMEQHFSLRLQQIQEEFARELSDATELLKASHKKELEQQWKQLVSEKEEALQLMESRHRVRLEEAENKTNFEEMRMRYERRDPRPEDLQQIDELKSVIESQDRDLRLLTERLREMQLLEREQQQAQRTNQNQQKQQQQQQQQPKPPRRSRNRGRNRNANQTDNATIEEPQIQEEPEQEQYQQQTQPIVQSVPIVCDVIYEENEADLIKEEQDEARSEEQRTEDEPDSRTVVAEGVSAPVTEAHNKTEVIVDVPDSAIQTETTIIQSTEPVFVETPPGSPTESTPVIEIMDEVGEDTLPELPPTPTIIITSEAEETEEPTEVSFELPLKANSKPLEDHPPAEPVPHFDPALLEHTQDKAEPLMPEMIVIRNSEISNDPIVECPSQTRSSST